MPISWATNGRPAEIVHSDAVFDEVGSTWPGVDVRNTQPSAITNLAFVIEYLDHEGRGATTAAVAAAAAGYEKSVQVPFSVESVEAWKGPVGPGMTARVAGAYGSVRTIACPESGRITFALVRFLNGVVQQYAAKGWRVPPLPRTVPRLDTACPALQGDILEIPATLKISEAGDVVGVSQPSSGESGPLAWAVAQVGRWKFHPALVEGQPRDSEMRVDFVFHNSPEPNLAAISPTDPAVLIDFFPSHDPQPRCVEAFAQVTEGVTIP